MKKPLVLPFLVSLRTVVACLAILLVLVFWGTLYQVNHGLWAAQERFFYSWFFLAFGWLPLPGGQTVLALLFVNLTVSMVAHFQLGWRTLGLVMVHVGLMLMLAGGWITRQFGEESFLSLAEGEGSNLSSSYRDWEVSFWRSEESTREVMGVDADGLAPGRSIAIEGMGLDLKTEQYLPNCRAFLSGGETNAAARANGSGVHRLEARPRDKDPQADTPGLLATVTDSAAASFPVLLYGGETQPTRIETAGGAVYLSLRRKRCWLPVFVQLKDFRKEFHPNTRTPKSFASLIEVRVQDMVRDVIVEMNEPFRFQGYTFYQASYADLENGAEVSTFAVTFNVARLIPYVATGVTVVGLGLHFMTALVTGARRRA